MDIHSEYGNFSSNEVVRPANQYLTFNDIMNLIDSGRLTPSPDSCTESEKGE